MEQTCFHDVLQGLGLPGPNDLQWGERRAEWIEQEQEQEQALVYLMTPSTFPHLAQDHPQAAHNGMGGTGTSLTLVHPPQVSGFLGMTLSGVQGWLQLQQVLF